MNRERALNVLKQIRLQLQGRGVAHAALFGSVARNESGARSDIDIVVTPADGVRLDLIDLGGVQVILEEAFAGAEVDVVVEPIRTESLLEAVQRDRVHAF